MTYPANEVLLRCACGNRDSMGVSLPPCSADCGRTMELEVKATGLTAAEATHRDALEQIVNSPHCQYAGSDQYAIGVADGHRCAADLARAALSGGSAGAATEALREIAKVTDAWHRRSQQDMTLVSAVAVIGSIHVTVHSALRAALSEPRNVSPTVGATHRELEATWDDFNADGSLRCNLCGKDPCMCGRNVSEEGR